MASFIFFFLLLGIISIISQIVIVRELIAAFFGNELFIGIVLGIWLLGTGLGSLLAPRFLKIKTKKSCFLFEFFLLCCLPLLIFLIRFFVGKTLLPGETASFYQSLIFTFLTLFPFCFLLGGLFSLGARAFANAGPKNLAFGVSRAYFFETIGFAIGGLVFNFFLVSSTFPFPKNLNSQTLNFRYRNLFEAVNSRYGSITVTKTGDQYNFYESGGFIGTNEDKEGSEYLIHTIFAFSQNPKRVLFIGGGLNGPLFEILKYKSVENIDYIELDPKLVEVEIKYLPSYLAQIPKNPKIKIHFIDGRRFLKQARGEYDTVIFNLPNPSTGLLNRFYTKECFGEAKKLLTHNGVLSFSLNIPVDYLSEEAKSLVSSIHYTIKSAFPKILILPQEGRILFLVSQKPLEQKPAIKEVPTAYFSPAYLPFVLSSKKIDQIKDLLVKESPRINTDFHPTAYFYQTAFWQTTQSFKLAKILKGTEKISWLVFAFFALLFLFFLKTKLASPILSMGIASFTLMTTEILIIFLFQSQLGYLFSKIALIFTTILVSMGLGNLVGTKIKAAKKGLVLIKFLIILYLLIFFPTVKNLPQEKVFYLLGSVIGLLVGAVFPLANKIYLKQPEKVGVLYSTDLFGAFFGAILPSLFFIPLFGIQKTIILLIILNLFALKYPSVIRNIYRNSHTFL